MQTVVPTIPFSHFVSLMFFEHLATISFPCVLYQYVVISISKNTCKNALPFPGKNLGPIFMGLARV